MPNGKQQYFDNNGDPLSGGKLYTYASGTSTPKTTYSDAAGTIPNDNPVILDARGEAVIFWSGTYKVILKDSVDATVYTVDGLSEVPTAFSASNGASLIGYSGVGATVKDALDARLPEISNYATLRVYAGSQTSYYVRGVANIFDGGAGVFRVDSSDTTSADNGGTILVDAISRRWKRETNDDVSVKWFGAKGNGVTDDTGAFQSAVSSLTNGGTVKVLPGKYYIASSFTIPAQVALVGDVGAIGSHRTATFDFNAFNCSLRLSDTATINLGSGCEICGLLIYNNALVSKYPFANSASALSAISAFAGTAISVSSAQDVYLHNLRILGFAQAISISNSDRTKMEWIDIDCTAGVLCDTVRDIARWYKIHCWPFLTYGYSFSTQDLVYRRNGSAFKMTTAFDGSGLFDCFSYGFTTGYDLNATTGITFQNCWVEGGGASYVAGQYGFAINGVSDQVNILGGGVDTCDVGIRCNATGAKLGIKGVELHANYKGVEVVACAGCFIEGNYFYYPHPTGGGAPVAWPAAHSLIHVNAPSGSVSVESNWMFGASVSPGLVVATYTNALKITGNTFASCTTGISTDSNTTSAAIISANNFSSTTTPYSFGSVTFTDKLIIHSNTGLASDTIGPQYSNLGNTPQWSDVSIGSGGGPRRYMYYSQGSAGAKTIVVNGNTIGSLRFNAYDGAAYQPAGLLRFGVNGVPNANDMPGTFIISTTPAASVTPVDRVAVNALGNLVPLSDNAYSCGASGSRWSAVWAANGTIQTSDEREKDIIGPAPGLAFINRLEPVKYKWKVGHNKVVRQVFADDDGREYGEGEEIPDSASPIRQELEAVPGTREHWGLKSQQVKAVIDELGIDFGGWVMADPEDPESQQALRYDQFIAPLIQSIRELSARIIELEDKFT